MIRNIIRLDEVDSTNSYVRRNMDKLDTGSVIVTKVQTKGKGRNNRTWESKNGNIYMSILQKKDTNTSFETIMYSTMAVLSTLEEMGLKPYVKYPNDILHNSKKICGILIERVISGTVDTIIGIGINVNQIDFGNLNNKATSLKKETNKTYDLEDLLELFINKYNEIVEKSFEDVFVEYVSVSYVLGRYYKGYKITGITRNGELVLNNNTEIKHVQMDEITLEELYDE